MSTHNIGFYEDLTKIIFELSSNTHLICSSDSHSFHVHSPTSFRRFFFYFLVYGSYVPNFCILEKNENFIFDFFLFSPM